MNVVFLATAEAGLRWFKRYYKEQPQLNRDRVFAAFDAALDRLALDPFAGYPFAEYETVRELPLPKCPFSLLFTHRSDTLYIIDLRDQRGLRSHEALASFARELRQRYGLGT